MEMKKMQQFGLRHVKSYEITNTTARQTRKVYISFVEK